MPYGDFKDLKRRTYSDKVLRDKAFNIAKTPKYDGYQKGLASMVYNFFDKKSALLTDKFVSGGGIDSNNNNNDNNNNNNNNNNNSNNNNNNNNNEIEQNLQLA